MSVMAGFEETFRDKIVGATAHISIKRSGEILRNFENVIELTAKNTEVLGASEYTYSQALLRTDRMASGLLIRGIPAQGILTQNLKTQIKSGSVDGLFDPPEHEQTGPDGEANFVKLPGLIIGRELSRSLGLNLGSIVSLLSPQVGSSPFGLVPKFKRWQVVGIYSSGLVEYESSLAYSSISEAQSFFDLNGGVSGIDVMVKDVLRAGEVARELEAQLLKLPQGERFLVQDWGELNKPLWDAIGLEKKVQFIVLLLIIVMASISVVNMLVMVVLEKKRDIAVLKTLGATRREIGDIFRIQGFLIGVVGTALGLAFGLLGALALKRYGFPLDERVFPISTVPVSLSGTTFLWVGLAAVAISILATIYPAWRASRLEPLELLRRE
jgi:lipoprotein-releasing system permease protein